MQCNAMLQIEAIDIFSWLRFLLLGPALPLNPRWSCSWRSFLELFQGKGPNVRLGDWWCRPRSRDPTAENETGDFLASRLLTLKNKSKMDADTKMHDPLRELHI